MTSPLRGGAPSTSSPSTSYPDEWRCATDGTLVLTDSVTKGIDNRPLGLCLTCRGSKPMPPTRDATEEQRRRFAVAEAKRNIKAPLSPVVTTEEWRRLEAERAAERARQVEAPPEPGPWLAEAPIKAKPRKPRPER